MSKLEELAKAYAAAQEAYADARTEARDADVAASKAWDRTRALDKAAGDAREALVKGALESGAHAITADQEPGA